MATAIATPDSTGATAPATTAPSSTAPASTSSASTASPVRLRAGNPALIGTLMLVGAGAMLIAGFAGAFVVLHRMQGHDFVPASVSYNNYGGATAAVTALFGSFAAQWAVTATAMNHRRYTQMAWALTLIMGVALANLIWYLGVQMELPINESGYAVVVYGLLAVALALVIVAIVTVALGVARTADEHSTAEQPQFARLAAWVWHLGAAAWLVAYLLIFLYK